MAPGPVTGADSVGSATAVGTRGIPSISGSGRGPPNPPGGWARAVPPAARTAARAATETVRENGRDAMVFPLKEGTPYVTVGETKSAGEFGSPAP
jgi:hypothetical protein